MINYIRGRIIETMPGMVTIENNGIGWGVYVPDGTASLLSAGGDGSVLLYTALIAREDDVSLYGFADRESLSLFRLLMTVSGIGVKAAMSLLSAMSAPELEAAIACEDIKALTEANGIGKKIAQRLVLELRDKVTKPIGAETVRLGGASGSAGKEAEAALIALGYSGAEAAAALSGIKSEGMTVEELIRAALRRR